MFFFGSVDLKMGMSEMLPTSGRVSSNMNENKFDEAYDPEAFVAVTLIVYNRYGDN